MPYCLKCGREIEAMGTTGMGMCPTCGLVRLSVAPIEGKPSQAKYCQYCGKEMSVGVSFCPSCGRPTKPEVRVPTPSIPAKRESKTGRNIIIALVLIFLIVVVVGYGVFQATRPPSTTPISTPTLTPMPTPTPTPTPKKYDVVIRYTERYADEIGYSKPSKGYTFLIITLDIEDKVDRKFSVYPWNFKVIVNNVEYNEHWASYSLDDYLKDVDLHKGGRISGSIVFEVPDGTAGYELVYKVPFEHWEIEWIHY